MTQPRIILYLALVVFLVAGLCTMHLPFFWDGTFFSETAVHFYEHGTGTLIPVDGLDTGAFPLYSLYLAAGWKLFGKTLAVSHVLLLPFVLAIVYQYFLIAKKFLSGRQLSFAMLLLLAEPVFFTQSLLAGYDILIVFFFLLALGALLSRKKIMYAIALSLLCVSSVRGIMLGVALLFLDIVINYRLSSKPRASLFTYVIPVIVVGGWSAYHFAKTGWLFFSPVRENTHESLVSLNMMLRQFVFIQWKIVDLGRVVLLAVAAAGLYFWRRNKDRELRKLFMILFIPYLVLLLFMMTIGNPAGHKYFIVVFLLLNIFVCYVFSMIKRTAIQVLLFAACMIALLSGNFWMYPARYGNAWDSSLKVLPYFSMKEEMDAWIREHHIPAEQVGTQFPLIADARYSHLRDTSFCYTNVWMGPLESHRYFLYTNVINTDIPDQFDAARKSWTLLHRLQRGQVCIELYRNEKFLYFQF